MKKRIIDKVTRENKISEIKFKEEVKALNREFASFEKEFRAKRNLRHVNKIKTARPEEKIIDFLKTSPYSAILEKDESSKQFGDYTKVIHELLITNGDIDLEKILCLHVLTFKQAVDCDKLSRDLTAPLKVLCHYAQLIPSYFICPDDEPITCQCWARNSNFFECDYRPMTLHLSINSQIERILYTVFNALEHLNESKLANLSALCQNVELVTTTLLKPANQEFLRKVVASDLVKGNKEVATERCSLVRARSEFVQDVYKYKKNLVFRLRVPFKIQNIVFGQPKRSMKNEAKVLMASSLSERSSQKTNFHVKLKRHGFQVLQKTNSSSGIAVVSQNSDVVYIPGPNDAKFRKHGEFVSQLNLFTQDASESGERDTPVAPLPRGMQVLQKFAKKHLDERKTDDEFFEELKIKIFNRLEPTHRLALSMQTAKMKNASVNRGNTDSSVPLVKVIKEAKIPKSVLLRLLLECTDTERTLLLKPVKTGGFGFAEILIGEAEFQKMIGHAITCKDSSARCLDLGEETRNAKKNSAGHKETSEMKWMGTSQDALLRLTYSVAQKEVDKKLNHMLKELSENEM